MKKRCLLINDLQNDFCPGGTLAVTGAELIIETINSVMDHFDLIIASRDAHPPGSAHFLKWPVHCVKDSEGAEFHPDLNTLGIHYVLEKGTSGKDNGYSAFEATNINLKELLEKNGICSLYVCGLATDYCVKATVLDALYNGLRTYVLTDCIKPVNLHEKDGEAALQMMKEAGAVLLESRSLSKIS